MSTEYPRKTAVIDDYQADFIHEEEINFSRFVRYALDEYIEHKRQQDDFSLFDE